MNYILCYSTRTLCTLNIVKFTSKILILYASTGLDAKGEPMAPGQ